MQDRTQDHVEDHRHQGDQEQLAPQPPPQDDVDPMRDPERVGPLLAIEEPQGELAETISVEEQVEGDDQAQDDLKPDVDCPLGRLDGARRRVDQAQEGLPYLLAPASRRSSVLPATDDRVAEQLVQRRADDVVPARRQVGQLLAGLLGRDEGEDADGCQEQQVAESR